MINFLSQSPLRVKKNLRAFVQNMTHILHKFQGVFEATLKYGYTQTSRPVLEAYFYFLKSGTS